MLRIDRENCCIRKRTDVIQPRSDDRATVAPTVVQDHRSSPQPACSDGCSEPSESSANVVFMRAPGETMGNGNNQFTLVNRMAMKRRTDIHRKKT